MGTGVTEGEADGAGESSGSGLGSYLSPEQNKDLRNCRSGFTPTPITNGLKGGGSGAYRDK